MPADAQLAPPMAVEAAAQSGTTVKVFWNAAPGVARYRIMRDGQAIGDAAGSDLAFSDTTARPNTTYRYSVVALAADGTTAAGKPYVERTFAELAGETRCDVLVVGATTAGVSAAVTAA